MLHLPGCFHWASHPRLHLQLENFWDKHLTQIWLSCHFSKQYPSYWCLELFLASINCMYRWTNSMQSVHKVQLVHPIWLQVHILSLNIHPQRSAVAYHFYFWHIWKQIMIRQHGNFHLITYQFTLGYGSSQMGQIKKK